MKPSELKISHKIGSSLWRSGIIKQSEGADRIYLIKSKVTEIVVSIGAGEIHTSYIFDTKMDDESSFLPRTKIQWSQKDCYESQSEAYKAALVKKYCIVEEMEDEDRN
ncbi:hypothetical protein KAR91_18340 [Candidatus Pacearchaeota archaeon]|nr:hypothetical protein [Candidatus Pacearchaeota archaeon]